jgi:hypothetical protein
MRLSLLSDIAASRFQKLTYSFRGWLSRRLLDQAAQRRAHHVFKVGGGEAGAAELQLGERRPRKTPRFSTGKPSAAAQTA